MVLRFSDSAVHIFILAIWHLFVTGAWHHFILGVWHTHLTMISIRCAAPEIRAV